MKRNRVYLGSIKRCIADPYLYEKYGEKYFQPDYQINGITEGTIVTNVILVKKEAMLFETSHGYIEVSQLSGTFDDLKLAFTSKDELYQTYPRYKEDLYVDAESLVPYYEENTKEKVNVKLLKREYRDRRL